MRRFNTELSNRSHNDYDLLRGQHQGMGIFLWGQPLRYCFKHLGIRSMSQVKAIPLSQIRRPLPRANDPQKVEALMVSIAKEGLREPIEVLEVDGQYYGFSGCHRFEAHQRLGKETILCRVRRATRSVLQKHLA